jgi:predicted GH43/DUF377 family glycosyl hydrolase
MMMSPEITTRTLLIISVHFMAAILMGSPAAALENFDFEARYFVHEGSQIWDFCLTPQGDQYNIFYHTISPENEHPANADTIWHARSTDLRHWEMLGPAVTSGPDWWDAEAVWAPDVVFDEESQRWAMLYTGVSEGMVQRACLAWSDDMITWTKDENNPVFEPDSMTYFWAPDQDWSSFRDPYVYFDDGQWNMLNTAGLRLGGYPGYRRAIVHHAVSDDLINWIDAGVFFEHDGDVGQWHDFESVQYFKHNSKHYLFFVEQDPNVSVHSTSFLYARNPADWSMADRIYIDEGWAPEVQQVNGQWFDTMFGRLHQYDDPSTDLTHIVVRFDQMVFSGGGGVPEISLWDPLSDTWPTRVGEVGAAAPSFGDNPVLRGEPSSGLTGHGWFNSFEHYGGPLSGIGEPGLALGDSATGGLMSADFEVTGDFLHFQVAGGIYPETCYLRLLDANTDEVLFQTTGNGSSILSNITWNLREYHGRDVKLHILDNEIGPNGWIAVDSIRESMSDPSPVEDALPKVTKLDACYPNPFNPQTKIDFHLAKSDRIQVSVFDLKGKRVTELANQIFGAGAHTLEWNGCDDHGRAMPSGPYFVRLSAGSNVESRKVLLLK